MFTVFGTSMQGESHKSSDLPCQDYYSFRHIRNKSIVIAAIADGLGSCSHSHFGAKEAVESALDYIDKKLPRKWDAQEVIDVIKDAFSHALDEVVRMSESMEINALLFSSTLTVAVYNGDDLCFGHAGDDGIVALFSDGTYKLITSRQKGDEKNTVIPLQGGSSAWEFGTFDKDVDSFVMLTDGILDITVPEEINDFIYFPFFQRLFFTRLGKNEKISDLRYQLEDFLNQPNIRQAVTDDITVLAVINEEAVRRIKWLKWDEFEWNKAWEEYNKRVQAKLYPEQIEPSKGNQTETDPLIINPKTKHRTQQAQPPRQNSDQYQLNQPQVAKPNPDRYQSQQSHAQRQSQNRNQPQTVNQNPPYIDASGEPKVYLQITDEGLQEGLKDIKKGFMRIFGKK